MAESALHRQRVASLVTWMKQQGVSVTHASGGLSLPDPYKVGRHEPDALATKDAVLWIGEAKTGEDLDAAISREQFADFSRRQMKAGARSCPFILCVPKAYLAAAERAVLSASGSTAQLTVIA